MLLICQSFPNLRILMPDGEYTQFQGGKLEIEPEDPYYEPVMAEATRNPAISILVSATTCPMCGEVFAGRAAKAQLGKHHKDVHFDSWLAGKQKDQAEAIMTELKARASFPCDVCRPIQDFPTAQQLATHVKLVHATAPKLDDEGNEIGRRADEDEDHRPGEVAPIPAATPTT